MPGKHDSEKRKFIGLWVHRDLWDRINHVRGETGISQFLRDAVAEKIAAITHQPVPREVIVAPDRAGKGGPRRAPSLSGFELNEGAAAPHKNPAVKVTYKKVRHQKLRTP